MNIPKARILCLGTVISPLSAQWDRNLVWCCAGCGIYLDEAGKIDHQSHRLSSAQIEVTKRDQAKRELFHRLTIKRAREKGYIVEKTYELGNYDIAKYNNSKVNKSIPKFYAQRGGVNYNP